MLQTPTSTHPHAPAPVQEQLVLCDDWLEGGAEMAADRERLNELRSSRYSPNTVSAYASDWANFETWCQHTARVSLPADPETVALYLSHLVPNFSVSTMARRLAAIASKHGAAGLAAPITPMVKHVLSSARKSTRKRIARKAAITIEELLCVSNLLASEDKIKSVRDRAALLLGFGGGFRRSDLSGLDLGDIEIAHDRVTVSLARGKTDQRGRGRQLGRLGRLVRPQDCGETGRARCSEVRRSFVAGRVRHSVG
jgi:site-specific recombinase XerC